MNLYNKTVQVGNDPNMRVCHKFEKDVSPTIVLNDKKNYAVPTPNDFGIINRSLEKYYLGRFEQGIVTEAMKKVDKLNSKIK